MQRSFDSLLAQVRDDTQSGASELALRTLQQLHHYLLNSEPLSATTLSQLANQLAAARPSMHALANALTRWQADCSQDKDNYLAALQDIIDRLRTASAQVAVHAAGLIEPGMTILSHSRSSLVLATFDRLRQGNIPFSVVQTLSAPGNEGLLVASQLNDWQIPVTLITDAEMGLLMPDIDINLSGCDCWLSDGFFVNKSGTLLQALAARHHGKPFWVLADSFKNSSQTHRNIVLESMPLAELALPKGDFIQGRNCYFETIATRLITGRIDEHGRQSPPVSDN